MRVDDDHVGNIVVSVYGPLRRVANFQTRTMTAAARELKKELEDRARRGLVSSGFKLDQIYWVSRGRRYTSEVDMRYSAANRDALLSTLFGNSDKTQFLFEV